MKKRELEQLTDDRELAGIEARVLRIEKEALIAKINTLSLQGNARFETENKRLRLHVVQSNAERCGDSRDKSDERTLRGSRVGPTGFRFGDGDSASWIEIWRIRSSTARHSFH